MTTSTSTVPSPGASAPAASSPVPENKQAYGASYSPCTYDQFEGAKLLRIEFPSQEYYEAFGSPKNIPANEKMVGFLQRDHIFVIRPSNGYWVLIPPTPTPPTPTPPTPTPATPPEVTISVKIGEVARNIILNPDKFHASFAESGHGVYNACSDDEKVLSQLKIYAGRVLGQFHQSSLITEEQSSASTPQKIAVMTADLLAARYADAVQFQSAVSAKPKPESSTPPMSADPKASTSAKPKPADLKPEEPKKTSSSLWGRISQIGNLASTPTWVVIISAVALSTIVTFAIPWSSFFVTPVQNSTQKPVVIPVITHTDPPPLPPVLPSSLCSAPLLACLRSLLLCLQNVVVHPNQNLKSLRFLRFLIG